MSWKRKQGSTSEERLQSNRKLLEYALEQLEMVKRGELPKDKKIIGKISYLKCLTGCEY